MDLPPGGSCQTVNIAQKHSQKPGSGIYRGVSDNLHSPMQVSNDTNEDKNKPDLEICGGVSDITHSPMQISDNSDEDGNEELLSCIETLKRELKKKEEEEKKLKETVHHLEVMLAEKVDKQQQLTSQIGKSDQEKEKQKKEIKQLKRIIGVFMKSSPTSMGAKLFLLDWTARDFSKDKETAHRYLQKLYKDASPNLPAFPSLGDLEALRQKWISWYNKDASPCFINTLCVWYAQTCPEVPFFFYNFNPANHDVVGEQFVIRHFFIVLTLNFNQRKDIPELYEKRYVLCYAITYGVGHMCVVSKEELDAIKSDNHVGFKFSDQVLQKDIEQNTIIRFIICLPRGDMSSIDGYYKIAEVSTLQQLKHLPLSEPAYRVKLTDWNHVDSFEWTKTPPEEQYSTTWPYLSHDICGEVRLAKGKSPF